MRGLLFVIPFGTLLLSVCSTTISFLVLADWAICADAATKRGGGRSFPAVDDKRGGGRSFPAVDDKRGGGRVFDLIDEDKRGGGRAFEMPSDKRGGKWRFSFAEWQ
jgi:hypothetical protein